MSELDLRGELVDVKSQPSPEAAGSTPGRILVKYGNAVTWSFPAVACSTWFVSAVPLRDFILLSHFSFLFFSFITNLV